MSLSSGVGENSWGPDLGLNSHSGWTPEEIKCSTNISLLLQGWDTCWEICDDIYHSTMLTEPDEQEVTCFGNTHELQKIGDKSYENSGACHISNVFSCLVFRGVLKRSIWINTSYETQNDHASGTSYHELGSIRFTKWQQVPGLTFHHKMEVTFGISGMMHFVMSGAQANR